MSAFRSTSIRSWVLAGLLLSISVGSQAAGLGKLTVMSALGEPLRAEVDLVAEKNEIGSLNAHLGNQEAFERAGLAYSSVLSGAAVSIEKRSSGEPYVKITSTKAATEPFVDLLIELTWSTGRISREFTALLDPPDVASERAKQKAGAPEVKPAPVAEPPKEAPAAVAPPAAEPEAPKADLRIPSEEPASGESNSTEVQSGDTVAPETAAVAPSASSSEPLPTPPTESSKATPSADAYGPVKRGDTLNKIASANKPADVSLEKMLVLLVRNNPQAFFDKNMNRLKTGKILQLPTADQYAGITEAEARKEVRVQVRDWHAYREQLATAAGNAAPMDQPAQQSTAGKVGAPAQDNAPAAGQPHEVLKLSKNEPAAASDPKAGARVRVLEEEVVARDKAVKEANDRVAKLEKQVTDLRALLEVKKNGVTPPPSTPVPVPPAPTTSATPPPAPTPEMKPTTPPPATPAPIAPHSDVAPPPAPPAPTTPKPVVSRPPPPMPAPEPSLMDQVLDQPIYLGVALGVLIIIGGLVMRAVKRRRESHDSEESGPARAFTHSGEAPMMPVAVAGMNAGAEGGSEQVDPVAEAEIFLAYGRDAQAEELLKEALVSQPNRPEVQLKLLQIYANRKDAKSFEKVARDLQQSTGGSGAVWNQAVALGYQVDPENPRYAAGQAAASTAVAIAATSAAAENVDFNIGSEDSTATTTDIDLGDSGSAFERTQVIDVAAEPDQDSTVSFDAASVPAMDLDVDLPSDATETSIEGGGAKGLDFDIDLNSLSAGPAHEQAAAEPAGGGLDFDMGSLTLDSPAEQGGQESTAVPEIDLSGISLDLGMETTPSASPTGKDDRWYDVQTKFDLAKAYQEMGDKDGAREILKEVLAEGDTEQKAAAESVLARLDS